MRSIRPALLVVVLTACAACASKGATGSVVVPAASNAVADAVPAHGSDTDGDAKIDLRSVAIAMETYATSATTFPPNVSGRGGSISIGDTDVPLAPDDAVTVALNQAGTAYCIVAADPDATQPWVYISDQGGIQASQRTCPAAF